MARVTRGSGSVFADLGFKDAPERRTKLRLAQAINALLTERARTQADAAALLGTNQPKISALAHYRLDGFSVERLFGFLTALGQDIDIVVRRPATGARGKSRARSAPRVRGRIAVLAP
jgi:predicted XRE-type DNA-binding protein